MARGHLTGQSGVNIKISKEIVPAALSHGRGQALCCPHPIPRTMMADFMCKLDGS